MAGQSAPGQGGLDSILTPVGISQKETDLHWNQKFGLGLRANHPLGGMGLTLMCVPLGPARSESSPFHRQLRGC